MKTRIITLLILTILSSSIMAQPAEETYLGSVAKSGYSNDGFFGPFNIGFNFTFYGNSYSQFYVSPNGLVTFGTGQDSPVNATIPTAAAPNNFIAPFWDDLIIDPFGNILYKTVGAAPNRKLVIQFRNMAFYTTPPYLGTFAVILYESGNKIQIQYRMIVLGDNQRATGNSATIGLENSDGTAGTEFAFQDPTAVSTLKAILFTPSGSDYITDPDAIYEGVYLTTNLTLPEPGIADLISPADGSVTGIDNTFQWTAAENTAVYSLQIATNPNLISAVNYNAGTNLSYTVNGLTPGATYYWTVFTSNATGFTWSEVKSFTTSLTPPLLPVPITVWAKQTEDRVIKLQYTGGDESPKTAIVTSLPAEGQLYQYDAGVRGSLISSLPATITDANKNVIYAATGSQGNGKGNFNFKINDANGDSPEATITINVVSPQVPDVLYVAKSANVEVQFDIPMADPTGKQDQFTITVDGTPATISTAALKTGDPYTIVLTLSAPLAGTEAVVVSYTEGDVSGSTGGMLLSFTDQDVILKAQMITWTQSLDKKFNESPLTLTATATSGLARTYSSSNLSVATSAGSVLTFHSAGTATLTARQAGNATWAPVRYDRLLTVAKGDQTIIFSALPDKSTGDPDFSPGATASSGLTVTYTSDNTDVATIVAGMIHIVGDGTANITASQAGNANYNPAVDVTQPLTVSVATGFKDPVIPNNKFNIYQSGYSINILPLADDWNSKIGSVTIFNIIGNKVNTLQNTEFIKNSLIRVESPSIPGIYVVEMRSGVMRFVKKVVIR